ncbi:hypothetical protein [Listeria fleischmannii]|uniref:Uncharacterized protein n=1 Tax=Listeria fleischmannii FSL S10-1203 TaxID=1265822 RepID=W7DMQ3_9LIST|nr:hypothetical protein [Listeria fleischmannii]EUJ53842.1 hypothetical protein MCOL2_10555 [Listeria fleischmannii FSL S10-1203]
MEIKIAGYQIKVEESDVLIPSEMRVGEYSPIEQVIRIASNLTKQQAAETFIHEILEAINNIYELGLDHDEQLCKLSVAIHQIVTDNKELINVWKLYD